MHFGYTAKLYLHYRFRRNRNRDPSSRPATSLNDVLCDQTSGYAPKNPNPYRLDEPIFLSYLTLANVLSI